MLKISEIIKPLFLVVILILVSAVSVFGAEAGESGSEYATATEPGIIVPRVAFSVNSNEMFVFDNRGKLLPETVKNSLPIIAVEGGTYVPIKEFSKAMGYSVDYDQKAKAISIGYMGKSLVLTEISALVDLTRNDKYFLLHENAYTKIQNITAFENISIVKRDNALLLYGSDSSEAFDHKASDANNVFTVQENKPMLTNEFIQAMQKSVTAPKEDYGGTLQKAYDVKYYKPFVNPYVPYSYSQMQMDIEKLKEQFPEYIKLDSAGKSVEGRDLTTIEFGNGNKHIYVFGSHHAREYISTSYIMKFVNETAYGAKTGLNRTNYDVKNILDKVTFHIIPMLNPDGVNLVQNGIESVSPELREKIRTMPINDGEGYRSWKANINGVDLNRNYPSNWVPIEPSNASSRYAGPYAASEPEVQAAMNYMKRYPMEAVVSMHSQGELLYWSNAEGDMGEIGRKIIQSSGFRPIMTGTGPRSGYLSDYVSETYNKYEMTVELCQSVGPYPYSDQQFDKVWAPAKDILLIIGDEISRRREIAVPTTAKISVNAIPKSFEAYNINQNNYFKLRDLASMLEGSSKQFDISWNGEKKEILLTKNQSYSGNLEEAATAKGKSKIACISSADMIVDGNKTTFIAYNIDGNNYFKLRDIMELADASVEWDKKTKAITVDAGKPYIAEGDLPLSGETTEEAIKNSEEINQSIEKKNISQTENRINAYMGKNPGISQEEASWRIKVNMDKPEFTGAKVLTNQELASVSVMVNKRQRVPDNYVPNDLVKMTGRVSLRAEAKAAFEKMAAEGKAQGFTITPVSGFRTVKYQEELYARYLNNDSPANVETYSARAGYSEHHTGLAVDVAGSNKDMLNFGISKEAPWVAENAYKYGWIVRYLEKESHITGYKSEPWHLRYVGVDIAEKMKKQGIKTLEEYLGRNML